MKSIVDYARQLGGGLDREPVTTIGKDGTQL
eukprot:CAMPEP_0182850398 /NCGR_PEP_ID=MMETSP0006_2-20121128/30071_1 /TAXON_ID=97485 /ORGANISM="Prymnesium parvum, Strain Texoma1" /LENGTH=30 /DNA_ID= /DNA_START= /DNA_END= /DNA_ORIENTATION=